jgi:hypothetical protein
MPAPGQRVSLELTVSLWSIHRADVARKESYATKLAALALQIAASNFRHILDSKPEAGKEKYAVTQLTIYALALSRCPGLPLKAFECAWFDEEDYFQFFPLPAAYKTRSGMMLSRRMRSHAIRDACQTDRAWPRRTEVVC